MGLWLVENARRYYAHGATTYPERQRRRLEICGNCGAKNRLRRKKWRRKCRKCMQRLTY